MAGTVGAAATSTAPPPVAANAMDPAPPHVHQANVAVQQQPATSSAQKNAAARSVFSSNWESVGGAKRNPSNNKPSHVPSGLLRPSAPGFSDAALAKVDVDIFGTDDLDDDIMAAAAAEAAARCPLSAACRSGGQIAGTVRAAATSTAPATANTLEPAMEPAAAKAYQENLSVQESAASSAQPPSSKAAGKRPVGSSPREEPPSKQAKAFLGH